MSLWDRIAADRDAVLLQERDGLRCTAIQLSTGRAFTGLFFETSSSRDEKFGIANCTKGVLWLPTTAKPQLQEQWRITRPDATEVEVTAMSFGARSGAMVEVMCEQVDVARFGAGSFGGRK